VGIDIRALVLEDNQRITHMYEKIFAQKDCEVDFVVDSSSCLNRCKSCEAYDLVILEKPTAMEKDINLEDQIRAANPQQKVFFLSPYMGTRKEGFESLKDTLDLIDKPFAMITLLSGFEIKNI